MIQVCSQCGTRWNVRDRQRSWCPRCGGTLLAPSAPAQQWAPPQQPAQQRPPQRPAPGYRWIAVRPGAAPPARRQRRPLGPTPRYPVIPRWGLQQYFEPEEQRDVTRGGPSASTVRRLLILAMAMLGFAVFAHLVRYILLLINRTVLLHPFVAAGGVVLGLLASVLAVVAVIVTAIFLANWLIARRAAAYRHRGQDDPRSPWEILILCLFPGLNVLVAPVFVIELATIEGRLTQLRRPIALWWAVWAVSAVTATWSVISTVLVSFFWNSPQGIADNTVITTVGYVFAVATVALTARLYFRFERTEPHRSAHRWVVVGAAEESPAPSADSADQPAQTEESAVPVETEGQNPAA